MWDVSQIRYLQRDEWEKLVRSIFNLRDLILFVLFYETGCTVSEITHIRIKDVVSGYVLIKQRKAVISPALYEKIQLFLELEGSDREFLFYSRQAKQITEKRVIQIVKTYAKRVGFEVTPQILRYTHIAHAYERNIPINVIMSQVGLKKARAIQIFSELSVKSQADAYAGFYMTDK